MVKDKYGVECSVSIGESSQYFHIVNFRRGNYCEDLPVPKEEVEYTMPIYLRKMVEMINEWEVGVY